MFKILVVNIGSTSFKYQLLDMDNEVSLARGKLEKVGNKQSPMQHIRSEKMVINRTIDTSLGYASCIKAMIEALLSRQNGVISDLSEIKAIGFKTVHAGEIRKPSLISDEVMKSLHEYSNIVPAHNPPYIRAIQQFQDLLPTIPQVAVFETFFHKEIPDYASTYSIPYEWYEKHRIRKYGFHGASHRYVAETLTKILACSLTGLKIISCHLGGSSSICAVKDGKSLDNSMGFSAQAGIPMSTRCGDIDPFIIPFIMEKEHLSLSEVMNILVKRSGLLGISGISGEVRDLEVMSANDNLRADLALNVFVYTVKKYIGAYSAIMGGLDALIFTGGIGENSINVRTKVCEGLEWFGIELDEGKNQLKSGGNIVSKDKAKVKVLVIPTNEELIVARETVGVLQQEGIIASRMKSRETDLS
jgi:acetate kinase